MTDYQQAAIEALKDEVYAQLNGNYGDFNTLSEEEAESILDAAEPHLRKKWAEEIRNGVNPPDTGEMQEWRLGFITGVLRTARFLEGAGEQTPKRKVPHTGPGHSAGDPSFCEGCLVELEGAGD